MPHQISNPKGWKVVTNCSSIKRRRGEPITPALGFKSLEDLCSSWVKKVQKATDLETVRDTYGGRTFTESLSASDRLNADLYVISAGLGLVHIEDAIPNYNLTVSQGSGSIADWLTERNKTPSEWWSLLNHKLTKPNPICRLATQSEGLLLALPSTYVELISEELLMLSHGDLEKVYIITSHAGQQKLDQRLKNRCLPYDERLDGSKDYQGTRNDFPQRALSHFVNEIDFRNKSIKTVQRKVLEFLDQHAKPVLPPRIKLDDHEIRKLIRKNWVKYEGKSNSLHRYLRDVAHVACEQKRFRNLWNEVKLGIY